MDASDFLPHIISMQRGYNGDPVGGEWFKSRTDDILLFEDVDKLTLICLGTQPKWREWFWNIAFKSVEWLDMGRVHGGFAKNVNELVGREDQPDSLISKCVNAAKNGKRILLEGHSRGLPIAVLTATQLLAHGIPGESIKVVGCAGARVGNERFNKTYATLLGVKTFVLNGNSDPVPYLPWWGYSNGKIVKIPLGGKIPRHSLKHYFNAVGSIDERRTKESIL